MTKITQMQNLLYYPIINFFVEKYNYKKYLELGLRDANNTFNHVKLLDKTSVDINPHCMPTYTMSTDEYFSTRSKDEKWDLIFIDASHEKTQVKKDFENSLKHLNDNGTIIMDDVNPFYEELLQPHLCHNAWEVFAELRCTRNDLEMFGIQSSFCGVVRRGIQIPLNLKIESTWNFLNDHRQEIINPLPWSEICKK